MAPFDAVAPDAASAAPASVSAASAAAPFFATMAAAPSHIVILHANRAGTINRLGPCGNGAHRTVTSPRARRAATCMRCAQLPAGYAAGADVPASGTGAPLHSGHSRAHRRGKSGRPPVAARRTLGGAKSVDGDE
ncbi:hypothetical protein F6Q10_25965 [Streptomyces vinaceus]|nr:hypothetical protein [Streptomyces vinaceus]